MLHLKECKISATLTRKFDIDGFHCLNCPFEQCLDIETKIKNVDKVTRINNAKLEAKSIIEEGHILEDEELAELVNTLRAFGMQHTLKKICAVVLMSTGYEKLGHSLNAEFNCEDSY